MRRLMPFVFLCLVMSAYPAIAQTATVADEVMGVVRAEWAAGRQKNVAESMKSVADDCTQFNSDAATRLEGKALLTRLNEQGNKDSGTTLTDEMLNPKVQVYGDVAIVSYNYFGQAQDKDGKVTTSRAKSTRVYAKQGGKWMLVHANFGADPQPRQ
jgi:ketosteroid isomerase-like protein